MKMREMLMTALMSKKRTAKDKYKLLTRLHKNLQFKILILYLQFAIKFSFMFIDGDKIHEEKDGDNQSMCI